MKGRVGMGRTLLSVKEIAQALGVSSQSIRRAYCEAIFLPIASAKFCASTWHEFSGFFWPKDCQRSYGRVPRDRRQLPAARHDEQPPAGKTGAEFPRCLTEDLMSIWTYVLGWFRFTVPDSTADEVIARVGGEWIKDKKGFLGYRQGWLSRGPAGGLGRIGTAASWAPRKCMWISRKS